MKGVIKVIIAGVIIIAIGAAVLIGTLAYNGWSIKKPVFETQTFTAQQDNTAINIEVGAGTVITEFYDGDKITIQYPTANVFTSEISENNGTFYYKSKVKPLLFWNTWKIPDTVIKLPKDTDFNFDLDFEVNAGSVNIASGDYGKMEIEVNAGKLTVNQSNCTNFNGDVDAGTLEVQGIACNKFECDVSAGKLHIYQLDCPAIKASVSAGALFMNVDGNKDDYNIRTSVSAGSCNVSNQTGSTEKTININVSAGSVKLGFAD